MKLILVIVSSLLLTNCHAQSTDSSAPADFKPGTWIVQRYNAQIIKITFRPDDYTHNENLSDAVILKPQFTTITKKMNSASDLSVINFQDGKISISGSGTTLINGKTAINITYLENGNFRGFNFSLAKGEKIFGGGERAIPLDRVGHKINLYNAPAYGYGEGAENLNYSVPFITSSRHYALFFDNVAKGYLDIGKSSAGILQYGTVSGDLTFYYITGADYPDLLSSYHLLTGTQPLPPRWAMGTFMSRFGYVSESQATEIYDKMKAENVPFDAVIFDLFWFGDSVKGTLGNLDWVNKEKWPHPQKMIADFKNDGVQTILITEPYILKNTLAYDAFKPYLAVDSTGALYTLDKFYFGKGGLIDLFQKDAQRLFWKYYQKQMNIGVEGWWGDLGEPENHPADVYHKLKDLGYNRLFAADEVHNIYGHYWTKMLFDEFEHNYPDKRLFSLNRSGFAGTQRYGIFPWSGDVSRSWSGYRAQLPVMLGMTMSGIPYAHADAGGFAGGGGDNELYVRWLQFAQYTPIFRPHGTALFELDPQAASFPSEIALIDTPYRALARQAAVNRYHLLPYNYTLCYLQATAAKPLASPLYYYFSKDTNTYQIGDEYMWGEDLLVAPVLEKGAKSRKIYLPEGNWYRMEDSLALKGGQWMNEPVTLSEIPVFVKAGSIIPMVSSSIAIQNTASYSTKEITWHYYAADKDSKATLFDDDGASKNSIADKKYELINVSATITKKGYHIEFSGNGGFYEDDPESRVFHLVLHGIAENAEVAYPKKSDVHERKNEKGDRELTFVFYGKKTGIDILK